MPVVAAAVAVVPTAVDQLAVPVTIAAAPVVVDATSAAAIPTVAAAAVMAAPPPASFDILHVAGADIVVGLRWDFYAGMEHVDLDASALVFDDAGVLLDAAFYNQLVCMGGAVRHSGDSKTGEGDGDDESISIDVDALPKHAQVVIVVINAHTGGSFQNVESAYCHVTGMADFEIGCAGAHTGLVAFALHRAPARPGQWQVRRFDAVCQGRNFDESMPAIRTALSALIDPALLHSRDLSFGHKSFVMQKGDCVTIPPGLFTGGDDFFIGLGWSCPGSVDLDASVVICSEFDGGEAINVVAFNDKTFGDAVRHQGDNTSGAGAGDDEVIVRLVVRVVTFCHEATAARARCAAARRQRRSATTRAS